jgi:hypothetical protein
MSGISSVTTRIRHLQFEVELLTSSSPTLLGVRDWRGTFHSLPESYVLFSDIRCLHSKLVLVNILSIQLCMEQEHIFKKEAFKSSFIKCSFTLILHTK